MFSTSMFSVPLFYNTNLNKCYAPFLRGEYDLISKRKFNTG